MRYKNLTHAYCRQDRCVEHDKGRIIEVTLKKNALNYVSTFLQFFIVYPLFSF